MKLLSTALLGAGMIALSACGGSSDEAVDNAATDTLAVPEDELIAPVDNGLGEVPVDSLGNEANALDAGNVADTNVAEDAAAETNGL